MKDKKGLVKLAEKELEKEEREKQVKLIKEAIKQTLEKIEEKTKKKKELEEEIRILKQDLDNIKAGRLDLIEERQKKSQKAREVSTIIVEKEKKVVEEHHHHHYDRWRYPYYIEVKECSYPSYPWDKPFYYQTTTDNCSISAIDSRLTVNCSVAKDAATGTYVLSDGKVKYLS